MEEDTPPTVTIKVNTNPDTEFVVPAGMPMHVVAEVSGGTGPYSNTSYSWTGPNIVNEPGISLAFLSPTVENTGTYRVTVTDATGRTASAEQFVEVVPVGVEMSAAPDQRVYTPGQPVTIVADLAPNYENPFDRLLDDKVTEGATVQFSVTDDAGEFAITRTVPVSQGRAAFSFAADRLGDYRISARYSGNANSHPADYASETVAFTVMNPATLTVSPATAEIDRTSGQPVTFSVDVSPFEYVRARLLPGPLDLGYIRADHSGRASIELTVPPALQKGDHVLELTGQTFHQTGTASVKVTDGSTPRGTVSIGDTTLDRAFGGQIVSGAVYACPQYTAATVLLNGNRVAWTDISKLIYGAEFSFRLPSDLAPGTYELTAVCHSGDYVTPPLLVEVIDTALPDPVPGLVDIRKDTLFYDEVVWLVSNRISTGFPDGTYRPYLPINRDAMAAFLYRQAGSPEFTPPAESPFTDVATDNQFYKEIAWLAEQEISTGWEDGTFRPYEPINRDAMAAFLYRQAGRPDHTPPAEPRFSDVTADNMYAREISWLASTGITTGYPDRTFRPAQPIDREAFAAFLYRFDQLGF